MKIARKSHNQKAQPSGGTKTEDIRNKQQWNVWNHRRKKKEKLQLGNRLGTVCRKAEWRGKGRFKPVLLARNLNLKYDATPYYKHMSPLPHQLNGVSV